MRWSDAHSPGPCSSASGVSVPEKGHADLVDALALVAARGRHVTAVLAGDGPSRADLAARIHAAGLHEWVHLPGYVQQPARILQDADLMVLPSHTEGLPNAALEAFAMDVPVLATRVGGTPEVVTDGVTGKLVPPHSPESLAAGIVSFLDDPATWRRWAQQGRRTVEDTLRLQDPNEQTGSDIRRDDGNAIGTGAATRTLGGRSEMKVLWLSQNLPYPPKTGVLQRNYNLIREASAFAEVHLVAIVKQDILPTFDEQVAARELAKLCATVTSVHLPIEQSRSMFLWLVVKSLFTKTPFTANWAISPVLRQAIEQAVSRGPYDVVFFDTISLAPYRDLVNGSPTALNHHNIESHLLERRVAYEKSALRRFYFAMESRKLRDLRGCRRRRVRYEPRGQPAGRRTAAGDLSHGHHRRSGQRRGRGVLPPSVTDLRRSSAAT